MSISLLGPMTRGLLAGIVSRMDVAIVEIRKPLLPIRFHPPDGIMTDRVFHTIVEATLDSSGERWLIDITGCQYGFRDILLPLKKYITQNNCSSTSFHARLSSYSQEGPMNNSWQTLKLRKVIVDTSPL
uniref:Uncharacterized protein n=1 Tax=Fusarium oxysporum (strain Fo5176) TaxID=660025 RepID=A0A0D2XAS8_FUSOF